MAKSRMIDTRFWDDNYTSNLDPIEKLLFLYCLTNTHTNICWVYEIPLKSIASDTGIDKDMVLKIMWRFESEWKIIFKDWWIAIRNFIKYQNQWSPKVKAWIDKELLKVPEWLNSLLQIPYTYHMDTVSYSNTNSNTNSNLNISSKEDTTKSLVVLENKSKPEINNLIDSIKQTLKPLWLIYKAGKQERQRAQNILTAKEFWETCEKAWMSREKFVIEIIKLSAKLDFWNWKIYNCETFYEHYPKVYNEARRIKESKKESKISTITF